MNDENIKTSTSRYFSSSALKVDSTDSAQKENKNTEKNATKSKSKDKPRRLSEVGTFWSL